MALKGLVQKQVKAALRIIADLGVDVTITKQTNETYDITTATVTKTTSSSSIIARGLQEGVRRNVTDSATTLKTSLLLDSLAVGALDSYDTVIFLSNTWELVSYIDDGYITTCELRRQL